MRASLKWVAARLAATRFIRSFVVHLVYPNILRCLSGEILPDRHSPSGIAEAIAWKVHAYLVLHEELAGGENCSGDELCCDRVTRARIFDVVIDAIASQPGDIFEFGVAAGDSFLDLLKRCPDREIHGFDSFGGLPEDWWTRPKGTFAAGPPRFDSPKGHLVEGWFEDSVPRFFRDWNGCIALLHIDCDLHSSTTTVLSCALDFCKPGTVVLFDEYYNYPGFAEHEWLAWRQARAEHGILASCIAYDGRRAAFRIRSISSEKVALRRPTRPGGVGVR